ncbi:hypothetical protein BDZ85DRAFT_261782 [Elsinoe ampelina]|uniref:2EXR domain-containing protein n=1 Tax=Elsinoe ampelina TaxID=302913 RepID=A0A6A6GCW2_9PEZI|nr:hypothetical protein BDZ85DRAFT_261782 [Elsinoe ampelina]
MPGFPDLPAELRDAIWQAALPEHLYSGIYRWHPGLWSWDLVPEGDIEYCANFPDSLRLEFNYRDFRGPSFNAPMLFVNHESRSVFLSELRKLKVTLVEVENDSSRRFRRLFRVERDVMFIASDDSLEFGEEAEKIAWAHFMDRSTGKTPTRFTIAVSESLIRDRGVDALAEVLGDEWAVWPWAIYVVKMQDAQASIDTASASGAVLQVANISTWFIHWSVKARTMEIRGPASEDATRLLEDIRAICDGRDIEYDHHEDMEIRTAEVVVK